MRRQRKVALDLLKPSARDLEYGLALHRDAFVAESYSLGLHAPADIASLCREVEAGASAPEYNDLLGDQTMLGWASTEALRRQYRQTWEAAGVSCLLINAGQECNDPMRLLKRLARYTCLIDAMPDFLSRATGAGQILANYHAGKRSLCLTLNGIPLRGRQESVEDELGVIRVFAQLGVRMMHLTYNRRNAIGDGCGEPNDGGLSDFGHAVVAEMNRQGVIIDLAHTGWKTCLDTCKATRNPVLVSHSTVHALNAHVRAKPDEVIRKVLDTGGTMGITNVPAFLGGSGDIRAFLDHLDYMVKTFGDDSVTIGTDRAYKFPGADTLHEETRPPRSRSGWERLWPKNDPIFAEEWRKPAQIQSLAWINWPLFTVGLVQRGHGDETIRKILGLNLLRVLEANPSRAHCAWLDEEP